MIENSRKETGVITYKLFKSTKNKHEFIFFEEYVGQEAMEQHGQSEHFKTFMQKIKPLLSEEPRLEMF